MKRFRKNQKGFTLVEIMSVAAIIAMMTAMSVPNFVRMKVSSNEAAAQASLASLYTLVEDYRFANGSYPETSEAKNLFASFVESYYGKQSIISNLNSSGTYWSFQGYRYDYIRQPEGWEYAAIPDQPGRTGNRYFAIDSSSGVREITASYAATWFAIAASNGYTTGTIKPPPAGGPPPPKKSMN